MSREFEVVAPAELDLRLHLPEAVCGDGGRSAVVTLEQLVACCMTCRRQSGSSSRRRVGAMNRRTFAIMLAPMPVSALCVWRQPVQTMAWMLVGLLAISATAGLGLWGMHGRNKSSCSRSKTSC